MTSDIVLVGGVFDANSLRFFTEAGLTVLPVKSGSDLLDFDRKGERYTLVHVGPDDGEPGGTYARAHHRVAEEELPALAERLKTRERPLVTCFAFAFKDGVPKSADWVIDTRFLANPYWVPELSPLTGLEQPVIDYVLGQPAAQELLRDLDRMFRAVIPKYTRNQVRIAFGCTGGRHRSVVMAAELARRLKGLEDIDVEFERPLFD